MTKRFSEIFEEWKEKRCAPAQEWENWRISLSCEDVPIIDGLEAAFNYGYGIGYNDHEEIAIRGEITALKNAIENLSRKLGENHT